MFCFVGPVAETQKHKQNKLSTPPENVSHMCCRVCPNMGDYVFLRLKRALSAIQKEAPRRRHINIDMCETC
jgi:hypothetical protein